MKLEGFRRDGALRVLIPGGMTVVLRGTVATPPLDATEDIVSGRGPIPPVSLSSEERQVLAKRLDRSRVAPAHTFVLAADEAVAEPAEKKKEPPMTKGDLLARITEIADAQAKAKAAVAPVPTPSADKTEPKDESPFAPKDEKKDEKKADEPPAIGPPTKPTPRFGTKRLKLEYEVTNREGEAEPAKKEEAIGTTPPPGAEVPDEHPEEAPAPAAPRFEKRPTGPKHLQPYGSDEGE